MLLLLGVNGMFGTSAVSSGWRFISKGVTRTVFCFKIEIIEAITRCVGHSEAVRSITRLS